MTKYLSVVDNNPGNFQELLHLIKNTGNELLSDHLEKAPHNATYRSKTVQDELIVIAADQIRNSKVSEVKNAKEFSILADEASDVRCKE